MRTIPAQQPGHVLVELVWPASRGEKTDCKNYTGVVWSGRGDVQNYPANLWHRLREHPDVWRLYVPPAEPAPAQTAAAPAAEPEKTEQGMLERQQEAAGRNTDLVAVMVGFEDDGDVVPDAGQRSEVQAAAETVVAHSVAAVEKLTLSLADLEAMSVQDVRELAQKRDYMLNPRLKGPSLHKAFLEMQALRAEAGAKA